MRRLLCAGVVCVACVSPADRPATFGSGPEQRSTPKYRPSVAPAEAIAKTEVLADESWETLPLADGLSAEVRAEHPRAKLDQLGAMTFAILGKSKRVLATGLTDICGDTSPLASRAGSYDDTDLTLGQVPVRGPSLLLSVTIETHSGEDIQEWYFQTALWLVDPAGDAAPRRICVGSGGEYHRYFEACAFVTEMSYAFDASGKLKRLCKRVTERYPDAPNYPDCAHGPSMECADQIVGALDGLLE